MWGSSFLPTFSSVSPSVGGSGWRQEPGFLPPASSFPKVYSRVLAGVGFVPDNPCSSGTPGNANILDFWVPLRKILEEPWCHSSARLF